MGAMRGVVEFVTSRSRGIEQYFFSMKSVDEGVGVDGRVKYKIV